MSVTFTGERVIPGQVDIDLWNEHFVRYAFAARLASGLRVLDAGSGAGYGAAELASVAASVAGVDVAPDAVALAKSTYNDPKLRWVCSSCTDLPFHDAAFDLVVAFEVIEHLRDWPKLLAEARRVLATGGRFLVSTPNKSFYAETRRETGANPFHEHEFEYDEFAEALTAVFPHVSIYLQDHVEAIALRPLQTRETRVALERPEAAPEESSFYLAICSLTAEPDPPAFLYLPGQANAVREKLIHIDRLKGEVEKKDQWLKDQQQAHQELLQRHESLRTELQQSNDWAQSLNTKLNDAGQRLMSLQEELAAQQRHAQETVTGYEQQLAELNRILEERTRWAQETEQKLTAELAARTKDLEHQVAELGVCVEQLHQTETDLAERTNWALRLDAELNEVRAKLAAVQSSRWVKLGRAVGMGPELTKG